MKVQFTTSCDSSTAFPNLTMYRIATIDDVIAFWQSKTMLLFKLVNFKRMVDKNLKVSTPPGTLTYYNTQNTVYILLQQNALVLYLNVLGPMSGIVVCQLLSGQHLAQCIIFLLLQIMECGIDSILATHPKSLCKHMYLLVSSYLDYTFW